MSTPGVEAPEVPCLSSLFLQEKNGKLKLQVRLVMGEWEHRESPLLEQKCFQKQELKKKKH